MSDNDLHKLLNRILGEIEQTEMIDEKDRRLLRELDSEIHELLGRSEELQNQSNAPLIQRLQTAINQLERTHPTLTMALSDLMTILSNAGI